MRVLVTGGAGYIGSVTSRVLLEAGHKVAVVDNLSQGHRSAVPRGCRFFRGDLACPDQLARVFRAWHPDCVLHFAAFI
ncbi:MAG: NAD-dependent epimerase/dehydratase family protein, partial [candidate division WOR-3 bacterium]